MFIRDLGPGPGDGAWAAGQAALAASDTTIGHIDSGLFPHPALGYVGETPPANILLDRGLNVLDPKPGDDRPVTDLTRGTGLVAGMADYPDHGVKTLSVILGDDANLRGVAPGAKVIPYRVANGPVFTGEVSTANIGRAIAHALDKAAPPKVFTISMGNTGAIGIFELLRPIVGGAPGVARATARAVNRAYNAGVITVCAAGQIIDRVVYPARFARTIAVGGLTPAGAHYPAEGYDAPRMVDVWGMASGINRAAGRLHNGQIVPLWADSDHPANVETEPSGTSYACPQVAAAAAMWVTVHEAALTALPEPWMTIEAFRRALRASASEEVVPVPAAGIGRDPTARIRRLNIEALMQTPPGGPEGLEKARKATRWLSWL